jgi:hypothetical protein
MMKNTKSLGPIKQQGFSKMGYLLLFVLLAGGINMAFKVGPLYVENNIITSYCSTLIESGEAANLTVSQLRNKVSDNLRINNVQDFDTRSITMTKNNGDAKISISYERRKELFLNLDVVAKFETDLP